jgi:molybdate transport system ATP-binding protein
MSVSIGAILSRDFVCQKVIQRWNNKYKLYPFRKAGKSQFQLIRPTYPEIPPVVTGVALPESDFDNHRATLYHGANTPVCHDPVSGNISTHAIMIQVDTRKNFDNSRICHSFKAEQNRIVLFGTSGAGKSVLLKMIAGFFNPDRGRIVAGSRVLFDTADGTDIPVHHRNIGYLPQEYTLFPNLNVLDNILYGIKVRKRALDRDWFQTLISRLEIGDLMTRDPGLLSGGQQQRVALARILIIRPDILLLDEPFSALDSTIRESLRDMVIDLVDELNIPTLLVTHDLDEAFVFAKELVLVQQGEVLESGARDELYQHPQYVESAQLLGFANIFPVADTGDGIATLTSGDRFHYNRRVEGNRPYLCIRPEHIMIRREDRPDKKPEQTNLVSGLVRHIYHHGRFLKITLEADSGLILQITIPVHVYERLELKEGMMIRVFLKENAIVMCESRYNRG